MQSVNILYTDGLSYFERRTLSKVKEWLEKLMGMRDIRNFRKQEQAEYSRLILSHIQPGTTQDDDKADSAMGLAMLPCYQQPTSQRIHKYTDPIQLACHQQHTAPDSQ